MPVRLIWLALLAGLVFGAAGISAQDAGGDTVVFMWNDVLYAQSLRTGELVRTELRANVLTSDFPRTPGSVYGDSAAVPPDSLLNHEGVYQGIWSPDATTFVFLALEQDTPRYRVVAVENGEARVLFASEVTPARGYLVPVGWAADGTLVLLERYALYTLDSLRLWDYGADEQVTLRSGIQIAGMKGNSATLPGGWVFVGFDTVGMRAYLVNIGTGQLITPATGFALQPLASIFETYPVKVIGVTNMTDFKAWQAQQTVEPLTAPQQATEPFLYWPLPDYARGVTCYPDSAWTDTQHSVECPGLAVPRAYQGHEGTDIGGKPDGLTVGTYVYAAAAGLVIGTTTGCAPDDITCGDSYGNIVLLEHSRVVGQRIDTWYTGYAHLSAVLVEPHTYIRELGLPIALSGESGFGGAHLHLEVRAPHQPASTNWIDPWEIRPFPDGESLWVGGNPHPRSSIVAFPPPTLLTCTTQSGNNIRRGPGTEHDVVTKSDATILYSVLQVQTVTSGGTPGDWYHVRWGADPLSGWMYAELMTDCTPNRSE